MLVKCSACKGAMKIMGPGMLYKNCGVCKGTGKVGQIDVSITGLSSENIDKLMDNIPKSELFGIHPIENDNKIFDPLNLMSSEKESPKSGEIYSEGQSISIEEKPKKKGIFSNKGKK